MIETDELVEVVVETLEGLNETITTGPLALPANASLDLIHASVAIEQSTPAAFGLITPVTTGLKLSAWLTRLDIAAVTTTDACDTISEICNLLAGSAKTILAQETQLSTPTVRLIEVMPVETGVEWTPVEHPLGSFHVALYELSTQMAG